MSKKDYKQGMSDVMAAYEAFGEKQEAAIRHVGAEIERTAGKVDKLGGKIGEIADYITDQEKAALYKLNTPVDIADLDDAEKRILLAVLYQLSADEDKVTAEQQNYVRAVQQYLKIYNPQTEIDLSAVENIEDISAQKAVLQSVLEFFRLGTHPEELTEEQEDFLDYFQVNRRTRREIDGFINAIVEAVGIKGLSEKYGFVAEQPRSEFAKYQDNGRIPEMVADACIAQFKDKDEDDYTDDDEEYGVSSVRDFENGRSFLETRDYIVFLRARSGTYGEEDYDLSTDKEAGLFCIHKQSGKVERISLDYKKNAAFFDKWHYIGYCIVKNTIYFTNRKPSLDEKVKILAVDVSEQAGRILAIPYTIQKKARIHISANESYLMTAILETDGDSISMAPAKTYVVDLTQNDRIFVLTPGLAEVYDGFLWDGRFLFCGKKKKDSGTFLYQHDLEKKTLQKLSPLGDMFRWKDNLTTIDYLWCVDGSFDYWTSCAEDKNSETFVGLLTDGYLYTIELRGETCLEKHDLRTKEEMFPFEGDEDASAYILLGDYLYRSNSNGWQKTNISNGWENLQWEIFRMPD